VSADGPDSDRILCSCAQTDIVGEYATDDADDSSDVTDDSDDAAMTATTSTGAIDNAYGC
jgi:hypothetical protein